MIGMDGVRKSGNSMLSVQLDDDNEDDYLSMYCLNYLSIYLSICQMYSVIVIVWRSGLDK